MYIDLRNRSRSCRTSTMFSIVVLALLVEHCAASSLPLQHVFDLMAPMTRSELQTLAVRGTFSRSIRVDDDVFGGSTRAELNAQLSTHSLKLIERAICDDADPTRLSLPGDAATLVAPGDVVFGDLCRFCLSQQSEFDNAMSVHPCAARVASILPNGELVLAEFNDVLSLLESLDVDFVHTPGTRTHSEAMAEARKRGDPVEASMAMLQFTPINFNYDPTTMDAKEAMPIPALAGLLGVNTTCSACFMYMAAGVEFALRMRQNGWGVPSVELFKLAVFGSVGVGSVLQTTFPVSHNLQLRALLLDAPLVSRPLVIPIGLLAITIAPSVELQLELSATFSAALVFEYGARHTATMRSGVQIVAGGPLQRIQTAEQNGGIVASISGYKPADLTAEASAGLNAQLTLGVGLTLAVLALFPAGPIVDVGLFVKPTVSLAVVPSESCALPLGYEFKVGMDMGATVSVIKIDVGFEQYTLTLGGVLPFVASFAAIESRVPPNCAVCRGCLAGIDSVARALLSASATPVYAPPLPTSALSGDALAVTTAGATSISIGAPLVIEWVRGSASAGMSIQSVTFALEVRLRANDTTTLTTKAITSEQLDVAVAFSDGKLTVASLRPFVVGLAPGVSKVRVVVVATHSDDLFGKSSWLDVRPLTSASVSPSRSLSGWSACSATCGSGGIQTRTAACISGDGSRALSASSCSGVARALSRPCTALVESCPFVRYSILSPTAASINVNVTGWTSTFEEASVAIEFNGGEVGRDTAIWACKNSDVDPCSAVKPNTNRFCEKLIALPVSQRGSTRTVVPLPYNFVRPGLSASSLPRPVPFSLLFDSVGGAVNDWVLTEPMIVRVPSVTYSLTGDIGALVGPVSIGSVFGAVVLPRTGYSRSVPDIGQPLRIGLNVTRAIGTMSLSISYGNGLYDFFTIADYRSKTRSIAGPLVAICSSLPARCVVCDPGDTYGCPVVPRADFQKLPPVCNNTLRQSNDARSSPAPGTATCGTSDVTGVCQDSALQCAQAYLTGKCVGTPSNIKCCPTRRDYRGHCADIS